MTRAAHEAAGGTGDNGFPSRPLGTSRARTHSAQVAVGGVRKVHGGCGTGARANGVPHEPQCAPAPPWVLVLQSPSHARG